MSADPARAGGHAAAGAALHSGRAGFVASAIYQYALQSYLRIRWRRWMTERYIARWLEHENHYRMQLFGGGADNPDQRIQEDVDQFIYRTQDITLRLLSSASTLVSFSVVLWQISGDFTIPGTEIRVPAFWCGARSSTPASRRRSRTGLASRWSASTSSSSATKRISASRWRACASTASRWHSWAASGPSGTGSAVVSAT